MGRSHLDCGLPTSLVLCWEIPLKREDSVQSRVSFGVENFLALRMEMTISYTLPLDAENSRYQLRVSLNCE